MALSQPQVASTKFKYTFKLHHRFDFPFNKTKMPDQDDTIDSPDLSRTIRGFLK